MITKLPNAKIVTFESEQTILFELQPIMISSLYDIKIVRSLTAEDDLRLTICHMPISKFKKLIFAR